MSLASNKKIAQNTIFLYVRMILTLGISLYTSRIVLKILGVEDYGIYNLVGGIIILFSFINGSMTSATQRFLNYEMGRNDSIGVHKIFCLSVNVYVVISLIVIILAETIGLWVLNSHLNIPSERMYAANVVYQFSVFTFVANILLVPYNASIIAYEKMSFYAWISIGEVVLKLLTVGILSIIPFDKLILYAVLVFSISILMFLAYRYYCLKNFNTCHYVYIKDPQIMKKLLGFSGWSMLGNIAVIGSRQGVSIIMNLFIGVTVNAAVGVANQVNSALYGFVSNFQKAFNPQIVKTFSSERIDLHKNLLYQGSKFSYFLLLFLAVPVLFHTGYLLEIWLTVVPEYTVYFTQLIILNSLLQALSGPFWMSVSASGNIKIYQTVISIIMLLNLPLCFFILHNGYSPVYVYIGQLLINLFIFIFRIIYVKTIISFSYFDFFKNIILRILAVSVGVGVLMFILKSNYISENSILNLSVFTIISFAVSFVFIWVIGINKTEKKQLNSLIIDKIIRK